MLRRLFKMIRICGRCDGSGEGGSCLLCPVCMGEKSREFNLTAEELTWAEVDSLSLKELHFYSAEVKALAAHNEAARVSAIESSWEKEVYSWTVRAGNATLSMPIPEARKTSEPALPKNQSSVAAWDQYFKALRRHESAEKGVLGVRKTGIAAERAVS